MEEAAKQDEPQTVVQGTSLDEFVLWTKDYVKHPLDPSIYRVVKKVQGTDSTNPVPCTDADIWQHVRKSGYTRADLEARRLVLEEHGWLKEVPSTRSDSHATKATSWVYPHEHEVERVSPDSADKMVGRINKWGKVIDALSFTPDPAINARLRAEIERAYPIPAEHPQWLIGYLELLDHGLPTTAKIGVWANRVLKAIKKNINADREERKEQSDDVERAAIDKEANTHKMISDTLHDLAREPRLEESEKPLG